MHMNSTTCMSYLFRNLSAIEAISASSRDNASPREKERERGRERERERVRERSESSIAL